MGQQKPILTKSIVFKRLLRFPFIMSIFFWILSFFLLKISGESMFNTFRYGFIIGIIIFLFFALEAIPHILSLNRQEKVMGFDFNEEMKKRKIRKDRINNHWYIDRGIVIRKGYIKRIEEVKYVTSMFGRLSSKTEARITYRTVDNKLKTITIGRGVSSQLENWVKKRSR